MNQLNSLYLCLSLSYLDLDLSLSSLDLDLSLSSMDFDLSLPLKCFSGGSSFDLEVPIPCYPAVTYISCYLIRHYQKHFFISSMMHAVK